MSGASLSEARALPLALCVIITSIAVVVATAFIVVGRLPAIFHGESAWVLPIIRP